MLSRSDELKSLSNVLITGESNFDERNSQCKKDSPMFWLQENLILMKEMLNWSEDHSWRNSFLKNPYFSWNTQPENIILNRLVNMHKKWVWVWAMIWFWVCYRSWTCYSETRLASLSVMQGCRFQGARGGWGTAPLPIRFRQFS